MSATRTAIVCTACGYQAFQWRGRCPQCGAWDSFTEDVPRLPARSPRAGPLGAPGGAAPAAPVTLADVEAAAHDRLETGIGELDRVLGGGLVRGSVVLLAGEPGAGKSTLALQAAAGWERAGCRVLLVCGEESVDQVAARARRSDPALTGEAGSVTQVRGCASSLARHAREAKVALLLVGHVTKEGAIAGPRVLEHLVDAVLTFEGDRGQSLRMLRSTKNRFGGTAELGVFEMKSRGLVEVADASRLFLADRRAGIPGSAVGCVLEGRRPVALEVQSLVVPDQGAHVRRVAHGLERDRHLEQATHRVRVWGRRTLLLATLALPVLALFNVFGQRAITTSAASPKATLSVHAPSRLRGGLLYQTRFTITAHRQIKSLSLVLSPGWFDGLTVNAAEPQPSQEASKNGSVSLTYGAVDAGKRLIAFIYWQVNPTTVADRDVTADIYDGKTHLAHVHRNLAVLP